MEGEEMSESVMQRRRDLLRAGAGTLGAAGLVALGGAALPAGSAQAAPAVAGLRPLYSRHGGAAAPAVGQATLLPTTLSDVPDAAVRALRRLAFGYRPEDRRRAGGFDQRLESMPSSPAIRGTAASRDPPLSAVINHRAPTRNHGRPACPAVAGRIGRTAVALLPVSLVETQYLTLIRAIYSQWQLAEVLADFWHAISAWTASSRLRRSCITTAT
jgi:hypothetical protein